MMLLLLLLMMMMMMTVMSLSVGDLLIIIAQIISAIQFVYEEKFINQHNFHPLLVVGLEGLLCLVVTSCSRRGSRL